MSVSAQIIEVLDALCEKFGIVIDWSSENIIPYITTLLGKLVSYEIWTSIAWIVFASILFIAVVVYRKKTWADNHNDYDYRFNTFMFTLIAAVFFAITTIFQTMQIIKCITFPELFVYEYVSNFIKSIN